MSIKKTRLFAGRFLNHLLCLVIVFSSLYQLRASEDLVENSGQKESCRAFTEDHPAFRVDSGDGGSSDENLSFFNEQFHYFTNALFRYDARLRTAYKELIKLKKCLTLDFYERPEDCIGLTDNDLKIKIDRINKQIAQLIIDKNRIVTLKDAFYSSLPYLIPILLPLVAVQGAKWWAGKKWEGDLKDELVHQKIQDVSERWNKAFQLGESSEPRLKELLNVGRELTQEESKELSNLQNNKIQGDLADKGMKRAMEHVRKVNAGEASGPFWSIFVYE